MDGIYYIPIALIVLIAMFTVFKQQMKKIARKDLNKHLLSKRNTRQEYYFYNEKNDNIYMINTQKGTLYYCTHENNLTPKNFKQKVVDLQYSGIKNSYKKICDNYYEIIEKDIYFDMNKL